MGRDRNVIWRYLARGSQRIVRSAEGEAEFEYAMVADLRVRRRPATRKTPTCVLW